MICYRKSARVDEMEETLQQILHELKDIKKDFGGGRKTETLPLGEWQSESGRLVDEGSNLETKISNILLGMRSDFKDLNEWLERDQEFYERTIDKLLFRR